LLQNSNHIFIFRTKHSQDRQVKLSTHKQKKEHLACLIASSSSKKMMLKEELQESKQTL
jgi:hypothetical protein